MSLLEVENLRAGYGRSQVLHDISFSLDRGESAGMVGRNGAGKSTLMLALFGLATVHGGSVCVDGEPLAVARGASAARAGLALTPQGRRIIPQLTVQENLVLGAAARRPGPWDLAAVYELFPVLKQRARRSGGALSGGQQQMLAIGRSLIANPDLLFLDEPSEGLAPVVVDELAEVFATVRGAGTSIFIVEQHLTLVRRVAERVLVLAKGQITADGPVGDLDSEHVKEQLAL